MILSILALLVMAAVAYMGAVQGVRRSARTLVACVLAGIIAFGLFGPLAGLFASDDPKSVWYYTADALGLWAVFSAVFLALRIAAEKFLRAETGFAAMADRVAGAVLGAATGYLVAGFCIVLIQMLPTSPSFLGYEAFRHVPGTSEADPERIEPGDSLWLAWDRGALSFFGYVSGGALSAIGEEGASVFHRYGDVYPPDESADPDAQPSVDADDFLYYHWYRRWEAIRWRTGARMGPIPEVAEGEAAGRGLVLSRNAAIKLYGMSLRVYRLERSAAIAPFPELVAADDKEFLAVQLRFSAVNQWPRTVDSAQFHLIDSLGGRVGGPPLIMGEARITRPKAKSEEPKKEVADTRSSSQRTPRNLRFAFPDRSTRGQYLMDGATFRFTEKRQYETQTLVFIIPKATATENVRLFMDPRAPETPPEIPAGEGAKVPAEPGQPTGGAPSPKAKPPTGT